MRSCRFFAMIAAALALVTVGSSGGLSASPMSVKRDGSLEIGANNVSCGPIRIMLPRRLPDMGIAGPGFIALNPRLLSSYPEIVRLFVFYHECGHHHVGGDELGADCWAVGHGVREGWLDRDGLGQVCQVFGNDPQTASHPSGRRRCKNLDRCFASALNELPKPQQGPANEKASATARAGDGTPRLLSPPTLVRTGIVRSAEPKPATEESTRHGFHASRPASDPRDAPRRPEHEVQPSKASTE
jgi:hypothetical protein